jgi:DNA-binding transcriptional MerR regulator
MSQQKDEINPSEESIFNIGAVSRMTGIAEATLRIWERRYGFPESARTPGGHRLYSQEDVLRLQWVKLRIDEGMQTSQAIRALQQKKHESDPLRTLLLPRPFTRPEGNGDSLKTFRKRLFDTLLLHDADQANQVLGEALALFPLEYLILDVIGPALYDIGEAWSEGRIDVATEHFATNHLRHHLLMWMRAGPPVYEVDPVVLACAPGELHEGSLLMLAVLLRRLRWPVIYLGQTMPLSDLATFTEDVGAAVIVFVAMTEETAHALAGWPQWLPEAAAKKRPVVGYGGRIFLERPELAEEVPGVLLGKTLKEGVETLDRMLHDFNPLLR